MTRSRIALFSVGFVLLSVLVIVGAAFYAFQHLPQLLRLQAERTLRHFGVYHIEYEGLRFSPTDASIDSLLMQGSYENLQYQARVGTGALRYSWRTLLTGKVYSLSLSSLEISVAPAAGDKQGTATTVNIEEFLPTRLLARLPLQLLRIDTWQASYRTPRNRWCVSTPSPHGYAWRTRTAGGTGVGFCRSEQQRHTGRKRLATRPDGSLTKKCGH